MQDLRLKLKKVIQDLYNLDFDPEITPSPENINADYSSNAPLKLAKVIHKSPMSIAEELKRGIGQESIVTPPGFLNFTISDESLIKSINRLHQDFQKEITSEKYKNKTVICEFSDPNPFKVLHVGHLYTSIVGDSIARLFEYAGAKVIRANFGGDVGLHVAKTMYVLRQKPIEELTIEDIAKCYVEGTAAYEEDESAHEEITKLNKEIYKINSIGRPKTVSSKERSEKESSKLADLYWRGRELSYEYFNEFYDSIGVHFDKYYPESTVADLGLAKVREQLEKGVYEMSDGAVIFDGDKFGLHTRVFINKEGIPTYETKDVGLIFTKWQDYHFDKSVVITGAEQKDYMSVVLKSVEQYAPELVERTSHLTHGLVKLPGGVKMSSRKGNFLKAVDVLAMVGDALKAEYDSADELVSLAATKYAFLKYKMGGNIIFDPKESVKMTGNSGPYLLYACVRAKKIMASANNASEEHNRRRGDYGATEPLRRGSEGAFRRSIIADAERSLKKKMLEYRGMLDEAVSEMAPHKVANYLYELAQHFSRFYESCPVIGSDQEKERIKLVKVYLNIMTHGLNLLGINVPEEM